jgi:uncharacterized cupin superfamily protein
VSANDAGFTHSHLESDQWEHDEETGGLVHLLRADEAVQAGLWKPGGRAGEPIDLELVAHETVLVLEGNGELRIDGGPPIDLRPGTMISIRKGAKTSWIVDEDFKEFWVYSDPES